MNKFVSIFALLAVASAMAAPSIPAEVAAVPANSDTLPALFHEEVHDDLGQFHLRYATANGIVVEESGRLVPTADGGLVLVYEGKYSFTGPDGKIYTTKYSSDAEHGFQVSGDHLPKAPEPLPVPEVPAPALVI